MFVSLLRLKLPAALHPKSSETSIYKTIAYIFVTTTVFLNVVFLLGLKHPTALHPKSFETSKQQASTNTHSASRKVEISLCMVPNKSTNH